MLRKKKPFDEEFSEQDPIDPQPGSEGVVKSEKEVLLELLQTLKDLGVNSIGDLEVKISRL